MAEYIEYHPLKFWLDPASIAEIVAHVQSYLVANPINSTTEIETIIHDYIIAHPELVGGVDSVNGETGEVVLTADNISAGESVTIADVLDSLQDQIDDIVASIPSDYQQLIDDVSDLKSVITQIDDSLFTASEMTPNATSTGWRLNESNGLCASNSSYKLVKYIVKAVTAVRVVSDDRFQFQNSASVPSSGTNNRVGDTTYQTGDYVLTVPQEATYLIVSTKASDSAANVYLLDNNTEKNAKDIADIDAKIDVADIVKEVEIFYQDGSHSYIQSYRNLWPDIIPSGSYIEYVSIPTGNLSSNPSLTVEVWEFESDESTITRKFSKTVTPLANHNEQVDVGYYTTAKALIAYGKTNVQTFYRTNQTGKTFYSSSTTADDDTLPISSLSKYTNMALVGGFKYIAPNKANIDFFSGYLNGNIIVFGDSTVDGSSTTGHTDNVIGTDRNASQEPNVFTSIVENMIRTFNGSSIRVYNGGFGGRTLNYIADNYSNIMTAFTNIKSALVVIDANTANNTRTAYAQRIRLGLERMVNLLQNDGIAVAIASPQPMFYYVSDNNGLPAINSAGEFAIAVNVAKDICAKYNLPFVNLGELTNNVMESLYLKTTDFYGDRIHFGDGGHKIEAYELYGELIHPIIYFNGTSKFFGVESNCCELSANSGISANTVGGYRSIVLQATNTRTDVLARYYVISKVPFKISGVEVSGWASYYDVLVNGEAYTSNTTSAGETLDAGAYEITIKPTATEHIVRFSGIILTV